MTLHAPFEISSRLLPMLKTPNMEIQLTYAKRQSKQSGRVRYAWTIDANGKRYASQDLQSGAQGGDLLDGFKSLLSFLSACGESYRYRISQGETEPDIDSNEVLFPAPIPELCYQDSSELEMLAFQLEEAASPLIEE